MSSFIINLNSVYRNPFQDENPCSYDVIVNPLQPNISTSIIATKTTASSPFYPSSNTSFRFNNYIFTEFSWPSLGAIIEKTNVTFPVNDIWSDWCVFKNNAVYNVSPDYYSTINIALNIIDINRTVDYYVGCILMLFPPQKIDTTDIKVPSSFQTAVISGYNPTTNSVTVQTGFSATFLVTVYPTTIDSGYYNYYIINPTGVTTPLRPSGDNTCPTSTSTTISGVPYNMVIMGLNSFVSATSYNILSTKSLSNAPTTSLFLQNVTNNWVVSMRSLNIYTREAILNDPLNSSTSTVWGMNDLYQLRYSDDITTVQTTGISYGNVALEGTLVEEGKGYSSSTIYSLQIINYLGQTTGGTAIEQTIQVTSVSSATGAILAWEWAKRGSLLNTYPKIYPGNLLSVVNASASTLAVIQLESISEIGVPISVDSGYSIQQLSSTQQIMLYAPHPIDDAYLSDFFYYIAKYNGVYFSYDSTDTPNTPTSCFLDLYEFNHTTVYAVPEGTWVECMVVGPKPLGLQMTTVGFQQGVCYKVRLVSLTIPNQPVQGINELPSFFPYLFLELYNTNQNSQSSNIIYSNNPNTSKVMFVCPIGNPRNQLTSSYVVIRSSQVNFVKWSTLGYLHFRVLQPNGETLVYNQTVTVDDAKYYYKKVNKPFHSYVVSMVSLIFEPQIVAIFEFDIVQ